MISIQHNMLAWNASRQYKINNKKQVKSTERLSSGYKINRAADDAAGLAISEKMRRQVRGLHQTVENIEEGIGYVQTADGALNEVDEMLQRMNELAVKGANGTLQEDDRKYIDKEMQALKKELDRVFRTTSFNDRLIWEADPDSRVQIGSEYVPAVTVINTYNSFDITDENCGVIPVGSYTVHADKSDGISVSWTGYDGNDYTTQPIDWDTLEKNNYQFEMSDYFGAKDAGNKLYNSAGNPQFTHRVAFTIAETATVDDIITSLDGQSMSASSWAEYTPRFQDSGNYSDFGFYSWGLNYAAAYASSQAGTSDAHTFDRQDDAFLEPKLSGGATGNLTSVSADGNTKWSFDFKMSGVGDVTATSQSITYYSNSRVNGDKDLWWSYDYYGNKYYRTHSVQDGTIEGVKEALQGGRDDSSPGLLSATNGGANEYGGWVAINFTLTSDADYTYGKNQTGNSVGSVSIRVRVNAADTVQDVVDRINAGLVQDQTKLDFITNSGAYDNGWNWYPGTSGNTVEVPIWAGKVNFWVQAGTEADQQIEINYDALNCDFLGMQNVNANTVNDCRTAIEAVKSAMKVVNGQRAEFGAYQNRLEHAANNNSNVEENTQAAESLIRDTNMASTMVEYSNHNILLQAGQAMLAQANQSTQGVLSLLQ